MDNNQQADQLGNQISDMRGALGGEGTTPLPYRSTSDNASGQVSDTNSNMSDSGGQEWIDDLKDVGHDPDLPTRDGRHALSTFEAARMFEEAECRVSERTIIRWCNKNKRGTRRLDCAFETDERKYYIAEDSVKTVIRDERNKGRQSEQYNPDLSDIEEMADTTVRHAPDNVGHRDHEPADTKVREEGADRKDGMVEENMRLKMELAKLEEQGKTKDEMMTFLRKEIDRRGDQVMQDRETYNQSLDWFRTQVESKDAVIERLNTQMRGLLEAPRAQSRAWEASTSRQDETAGYVRDVPAQERTEQRNL